MGAGQGHVMWYDNKYYGGDMRNPTFKYDQGVVYAKYDSDTREVKFGLLDRNTEDVAFSNIDQIGLYPVISLRKDTEIQIL